MSIGFLSLPSSLSPHLQLLSRLLSSLSRSLRLLRPFGFRDRNPRFSGFLNFNCSSDGSSSSLTSTSSGWPSLSAPTCSLLTESNLILEDLWSSSSITSFLRLAILEELPLPSTSLLPHPLL